MDAKNALEKLNGFNFQNRYLVGKSQCLICLRLPLSVQCANRNIVLWHQPEKTLKMKESKEDVQARQESLGQLKKQYGID